MGNIEVWNWERWVLESLTEEEPVPTELSDAERYQWLKEYATYNYFEPTVVSLGYFVVTDCEGRVTKDHNLDDAIDMAAAKFKESNPDE